MLLSIDDLARFIGGQVQAREVCQSGGSYKVGAQHSDMRCGAALFQGEIIRLEIVRESLQARVKWFAKNDGCPTHISPRWKKCYSKIWQWNIGGVSEASIIRNDIAGLIEIPLVVTDRRLILFQKRYAGNEFGGLITVDQVVPV